MKLTAIALLLLVSGLTAADPLEGLDADVAKALKAHGVPGVAIAVVKDGKVILAQGFGTKTFGKDEPVTEKTLFAIGSVTKSFTAAMVAMLVDEKKMKWDDPLRKHLPEFRMNDRSLSDEITIRDCLGHRCGLARNELVWYGSPFSRKQIIERVKLIKSDASLRTRFIYNNIMVMAAGEAAGKAAGKSWDDFMVERLFKPLGMTTANTSIKSNTGDVATPHTKVNGIPTAVAWRNIDNCGPAGSINASVTDMAEYIKFQLAQGKAEGKRLIERDTFKVMHTPLTILPRAAVELNPDAKMLAYGLTWMVSDFRGTTLIDHGGNIDGMTAALLLLPEKKIGVVVLANLTGSLLPQTLGFDILDRMLGNESKNLAVIYSVLSFLSEFGLQVATAPDESSRIKDTKPSYDLAKYEGKYQDELHPSLLVKHADGKLTVDFNTFIFDLEHWHYDTFLGTDRTHTLPKTLITFDQTSDGGVAAVRFKPLVTEEFRFKKVSDKPKR